MPGTQLMINLQIPTFPKAILAMKSLNCFWQCNLLTFCSAIVRGCAKATDGFSTLDVLPLQYNFVPIHRKLSEFAPFWGQRARWPFWVWAVLALGRSLTLGGMFTSWPLLVFVHRPVEKIAQPTFETIIYVHFFIYLIFFEPYINTKSYFPV